MGATSNRDAKGIHFGEADRRVKGRFIEMDGQWSVYRTSYKRNGAEVEVKWLTHYYPLVDLKLRREDVAKLITAEGIPFLITSECDGCPHKDLPRWLRQTPDTLQRIADVEAKFNGEYFFTDRRKPLIEAIADMQRDLTQNPDMFAREADFGCGNAECGV